MPGLLNVFTMVLFSLYLSVSIFFSLSLFLSLSRGHHLSFSLPLCLLSSRLISPLCHPSFRAVNAYPEGPGGSGGPLNSVPADTNADVRSHTRAHTHTWAYTHKRTQEDTHTSTNLHHTHIVSEDALKITEGEAARRRENVSV